MKKLITAIALVAMFFVISTQVIFASQTFSVEIETYIDSNEPIVNNVSTNKGRGEKYSFDGSGIAANYDFAYYAINGVVRDDLPENYQFTVRSNMKITAIFHPHGRTDQNALRHVVVFADSNGYILDVQYIADGQDANDSSIVLPDKPNAVVATPKWNTTNDISSITAIDSNRVYYLQYELESGLSQVQLTVTGATGSGLYDLNEIATVVADSEQGGIPFSHFEDADGNLLSTLQTYRFTMVKETSITAIYSNIDVPIAPLVNMSNTLNIRENYTSYLGQFELPSGYELVEYGFIISRSSDVLTLDSLGATIVPSNVHDGLTKEFLRSFPTDSYNSIRAYIIVLNNTSGLTENYYSENYFRNPTSIGESGTYYTGFDGVKKSSYASSNVVISGITWTLDQALVGADDNKVGTDSVRNRGSIFTNSGFSGISSVTFKAALYGSDDPNTIKLLLSNDGINWVDVSDGLNETDVTSSSLVDYTFTLANSSTFANSALESSELLRVKLSVGVLDERINIDELSINYSAFNGPIHEIKYNNEGIITEEMLPEGNVISNEPSKDNYVFDGWYLEDTFTTLFDQPVTKSLELFAKFTPEIKTITFNYNGADGGEMPATLDGAYDSFVDLPVPSKTGYDFGGWFNESLTTEYSDPYQVPSVNRNMYAKWDINDLGRTMADANEISLPGSIDEATTLTLPSTGTNLSSITWTSSNGTIINATTGVVTLPEETTLVTLTATVSLNGETTIREIEIIVYPSGVTTPDPVTYLETFTGAPTSSGSSYSTREWTTTYLDNSQVSWIAEKVRTDQAIDGTTITFQNKTGAYLLANTINNGISSLSLESKTVFSGSSKREITVLINDVIVKVFSVTSTVSTFEISEAELLAKFASGVSGTFKLEIRNTGNERVTIDNLTWTSNP